MGEKGGPWIGNCEGHGEDCGIHDGEATAFPLVDRSLAGSAMGGTTATAWTATGSATVKTSHGIPRTVKTTAEFEDHDHGIGHGHALSPLVPDDDQAAKALPSTV